MTRPEITIPAALVDELLAHELWLSISGGMPGLRDALRKLAALRDQANAQSHATMEAPARTGVFGLDLKTG